MWSLACMSLACDDWLVCVIGRVDPSQRSPDNLGSQKVDTTQAYGFRSLACSSSNRQESVRRIMIILLLIITIMFTVLMSSCLGTTSLLTLRLIVIRDWQEPTAVSRVDPSKNPRDDLGSQQVHNNKAYELCALASMRHSRMARSRSKECPQYTIQYPTSIAVYDTVPHFHRDHVRLACRNPLLDRNPD